MVEMCKTGTMRSKNNGSYIFFEDNHSKVYYTLVARNGETLRRGEMSISANTFVHYMESIGFEFVKVGELL